MMRTFLFLLLVMLNVPAFAHADPFTGRATADQPTIAAEASTLTNPSWFERTQLQLRDWQKQLYEMMAAEVAALKGREPGRAFWLLLGISFLYGVFHAAAPGHGKTIVASYFIGRRARWWHGVSAGFIFALGHSVSAVAIVALLAIVLKLSNIEVMEQAVWVGVVGYGLIIAIGCWLLWRGIFRPHQHCGHDHHRHAHDHHDHGHDHQGHHHDHHHDHSPLRQKDAWALFVSASMAPCTGTMLVLLFSLAASILWAGIIAAVAVALGMWLTIAAIGMATIWLNTSLDQSERLLPWRERIRRGLSIAGAILIILAGSLLLSATLGGLPA